MLDKLIDRVRSLGAIQKGRLVTITALIALTLVNAINVRYFQSVGVAIVLGVVITAVMAIDIWFAIKSRRTNPKEVWHDATADDKRLPVALVCLFSLFSFYAFGWLHVGLWVWILTTYAAVQFAYGLLKIIMQSGIDNLSLYIEIGTYLVAIIISFIDIFTVRNQMKGIPILGFLFILILSMYDIIHTVPLTSDLIEKGPHTLPALRVLWIISIWGSVFCKGSIIIALIATVLFGLIKSFSTKRLYEYHLDGDDDDDNDRSGRSRFSSSRLRPDDGNSNHMNPIEDENVQILLPKFHPKIPYTWIPNPFRTIWVRKNMDRVELIDKWFMSGKDSTDLCLIGVGDIDCKTNPLLSIVGFFQLSYVEIHMSCKNDIKFYVSTKFGDYVKDNLDRWTDWTCKKRDIKRVITKK